MVDFRSYFLLLSSFICLAVAVGRTPRSNFDRYGGLNLSHRSSPQRVIHMGNMIQELRRMLMVGARDADLPYINNNELLASVLRDRDYDMRRSLELAKMTIAMRVSVQLEQLQSSFFTCDMSTLAFWHGLDYQARGVIWVRLGDISRQVSRMRPRKDLQGLDMMFIKYASWLINLWAEQNVGLKATIVIDFEDHNRALSNKYISRFIKKLDELFPELFELIIHLRYRKLEASSPINSVVNFIDIQTESLVLGDKEKKNKIKNVTFNQLANYIPRGSNRIQQGRIQDNWPLYLTTRCQACDEVVLQTGCRRDKTREEQIFFDAIYHNCNRPVSKSFY